MSTTSTQSTFTSLFISLIFSSFLSAFVLQLGYSILREGKEGILWRVFVVILSLIANLSTALSALGVYEVLLDSSEVMIWPFAINLSLLLTSTILIQLYFTHKLSSRNGPILANTLVSVLAFSLLVQIGVGVILLLDIFKVSNFIEIFGIGMSLNWMMLFFLCFTLASDLVIFTDLIWLELKSNKRGFDERWFEVIFRVVRKTNVISMLYSTVVLIIFIVFHQHGFPFGLVMIKGQIGTLSMYLSMNTQDDRLAKTSHLSSLSDLFKGTSFRTNSRGEGHINPFVMTINQNSSGSFMAATPNSSRWLSTQIPQRPTERLVRRNTPVFDEISVSDYGTSSGVEVSTPNNLIFSEGMFSRQQNQPPCLEPPRYGLN